MKDTIVYIDGYNLYHAINDLNDDSLKWLDLRALSESLLRQDERLKQVKYFSAYATHIPDAYKRHRLYVSALQEERVNVIMGQFKKKYPKCKICGAKYKSYEEKETDVNIAIHLVTDTFLNSYDRAIVISADTDMRSAIEMARGINGTKQIDSVSPPKRMKYARVLNPLFEVTLGKIRASRLKDRYKTKDGQIIQMPLKYKKQTI